jgi:RimJ/RimL family protein N-acetyltransferase
LILWVGRQDPAYKPVIEFITRRIWGEPREMTDGTAMVVTDGNQVIGACLFHNWHPEEGVVELTSASVSERWLSRPVLSAMFGYAFDDLKCQAAILRVDPANARMCRIAAAFGFKRYDIPRLRGRDKAEAIFVLGDDEWRSGRFRKEG